MRPVTLKVFERSGRNNEEKDPLATFEALVNWKALNGLRLFERVTFYEAGGKFDVGYVSYIDHEAAEIRLIDPVKLPPVEKPNPLADALATIKQRAERSGFRVRTA